MHTADALAGLIPSPFPRHSPSQFIDGVLIVRIGASMYFANVAFIRDKLRELVFTFYDDAPEAHQVAARLNTP